MADLTKTEGQEIEEFMERIDNDVQELLAIGHSEKCAKSTVIRALIKTARACGSIAEATLLEQVASAEGLDVITKSH
jgi:hypothetical protein